MKREARLYFRKRVEKGMIDFTERAGAQQAAAGAHAVVERLMGKGDLLTR